MKKYYLVTHIGYFVDPHGSPDEGHVSKSVEYTDQYEGLEEGVEYTSTYDEDDLDSEEEIIPVDEADWEGSCDGYNMEESGFRFKEITKEEYTKFKKIIEAYDNLP